MLNFYKVWKEDKEADYKPKPSKKGFKCIVCGKRINNLPVHMEQAHGKGTWKRYLWAVAKKQEQERAVFLALMETDKWREEDGR